MKKKISKILVMICVVFSVVFCPTVAYASQDSFIISDYNESFIPTGDGNAKLNIEMAVTTSDEGLIYIPMSVVDSEIISATINGEKASAEVAKIGSVSVFVLTTDKVNAEVSVSAEINCPGFYDVENADPETGIPTPKMSYKFVNKSFNKIEKYTVTIALPEGMEPMTVTTPKDVTKYTLGMNDAGQRTLSQKSSVAVAGNVTFDFTFGKPFVGSTLSKIIAWILIIGTSAYVIKKRMEE